MRKHSLSGRAMRKRREMLARTSGTSTSATKRTVGNTVSRRPETVVQATGPIHRKGKSHAMRDGAMTPHGGPGNRRNLWTESPYLPARLGIIANDVRWNAP